VTLAKRLGAKDNSRVADLLAKLDKDPDAKVYAEFK